jgi:putative transcriptional regulator
MADLSLRGRLLVASPSLEDPNFHRSVVLLLEHDENGALGVILNRPSVTDVDVVLPDWAELAPSPGVVFAGGPVSPGAAIGLGRAPEASAVDGWAPLFGHLGTVDLSRPPDDVPVAVEAVRVFAGYAGWGEGQLEGELDEGAWLVLDAEPGDVMSDNPADLWSDVLRRQEGTTAWLANFPPDPSLN